MSDYYITDDSTNKTKWNFPSLAIAPQSYILVFCSGKDRKPVSGFKKIVNENNFIPQTGWNMHNIQQPFVWDGTSSLLIQTNSYAGQYTLNSVFNQSNTNFYSSLFNYQDGSAAILQTPYGYRARQRPNIKINQAIIGTGNIRNGSTDYPAPYGNWYWASKHQFLIQAAELQALGISSGNIDSIGFDVFWTDPNTQYDYFDVFIKQVNLQDIESIFQPVDTNNYLHSNFKISSSGENIYLYDQNQNLVHSLFVQVSDLDNSRGCLPDGSATILTFEKATPKASNNNSYASNVYLSSPSFSLNPGFYNQMQYVEILH